MSGSRFFTMRSGVRMPTLALGTFRMEGDVVKEAVDRALHLGYRHIDTARSYRNEADIGEVINSRIKAGKLSRKDIFLTTKVPAWCLSRSAVIDSANRSLDELKLKYVDMLLIHYPWGYVKTLNEQNERRDEKYVDFDLNDAWDSFESLLKQGKAKHIGVSNFSITNLEAIRSKAKHRPDNLQLECHAYLQQRQLREYCNKHGIALTAYAPLGAANYVPEEERLRPGYKDPELLSDSVVSELARAHRKTAGQILLRFLHQEGLGVLPKTKNYDRLKENMDIFDWELSEEDMEELRKLDRGVKYFKFLWASRHPKYQPNEPF